MAGSGGELNLVVLTTSDMNRARKFYEGLFNLKFDHHTDHGPPHFGVSLGNTYLEIYPSKGEKPCDRYGFRVPNIDECLVRIEGMETDQNKYIISRKADSKWGFGAILRDPDGRRIFLSYAR